MVPMHLPANTNWLRARSGTLYVGDAQNQIQAAPEDVYALQMDGAILVAEETPVPAGASETRAGDTLPAQDAAPTMEIAPEVTSVEAAPTGEYLPPPPEAPTQPAVPEDQQARSTNG